MRRLALLALISSLALVALVVVPELPAQARPLPEAQPLWQSPSPAPPSQVGLALVQVEGGLRLLGAEERVSLPLPEGAELGAPEQLNDGLHERVRQRFSAPGELADLQEELRARVGGGELVEEPGWASLRQRRGELELELVLWQEDERVAGEWVASRPSEQEEPPLSSPLRYALVDRGLQVSCEDEELLATLPLPPGAVPEEVRYDGQALRAELSLEQDCGELALWAADRLDAAGTEVEAEGLDLRWSEGQTELALTTRSGTGRCILGLEARADCGW